MALLVWEEVTWPAFVAGLEGFRDHFPRAARAPDAFPENASDIISLLNTWACRLSTERAPGALETWLEDNRPVLENVGPLTISDPRLPAHAEELGERVTVYHPLEVLDASLTGGSLRGRGLGG